MLVNQHLAHKKKVRSKKFWSIFSGDILKKSAMADKQRQQQPDELNWKTKSETFGIRVDLLLSHFFFSIIHQDAVFVNLQKFLSFRSPSRRQTCVYLPKQILFIDNITLLVASIGHYYWIWYPFYWKQGKSYHLKLVMSRKKFFSTLCDKTK